MCRVWRGVEEHEQRPSSEKEKRQGSAGRAGIMLLSYAQLSLCFENAELCFGAPVLTELLRGVQAPSELYGHACREAASGQFVPCTHVFLYLHSTSWVDSEFCTDHGLQGPTSRFVTSTYMWPGLALP